MTNNKEIGTVEARLTTPRAAAVAGIVFSLLLIICLVLIRQSMPVNQQDTGDWLSSDSDNVALALNLLPFAGIAFLYFIGVVRDRLGQYEDRFFATVFLGSGLLFLAMQFTSAAITGGMMSFYGTNPEMLIDSDIYIFGRTVTFEIINVYAYKMAGVFMLSTCILSLRTRIIPRWMALLGIVLALLLVFGSTIFYWATLVFPLWVFMISVYILLSNMGGLGDEPAEGVQPG